MSMEK